MREISLQQADLKVERYIGDDLLRILQDLLSNQQQLHQQVKQQVLCSTTDSTLQLERALDVHDSLIEQFKSAALQMRASNFTKLFRQMKALAMDMSRRLDKCLDITLEGSDVVVDVALIEALEGPLAHMVRNAVEYCIESPNERLAAGKIKKGMLTIVATCQRGYVSVEVHDDGVGPAALTSSSDGTVCFPVSGLQCVKHTMKDLHGSFSIEERIQGGSVAKCSLPLPFQFLNGVVFRSGKHHLVIPAEAIERIQPIYPEQRVKMDRCEVLFCHQKTIPFLDLGKIFIESDHIASHPSKAILVKTSTASVALGVNDIHGRYRGALSPMPACCSWHPALSGCVLLSEGMIGFALDLDILASTYHGEA
ncbi:chemotaxis protein CheW [Desulfovibrio inopinatus]|uniref:chemotaxis protein CheW n=1 Tax=Desulfovibrio inopinatus TaxID=102109 RepID=UPI00146FBE19|nr:chemotaxis protein CheW [Desulfovibrio inopinatus]